MNLFALEKFKAEFPHINVVKEPCENSIFCAYELIEHLWSDEEIVQHVNQLKVVPKTIMLSTPLCTFNSPAYDWRTADLGHLRTYTDVEFMAYGMKHWPDRKWSIAPERVMLLVGKL